MHYLVYIRYLWPNHLDWNYFFSCARYNEAIEPYEKCLSIGKDIGNDRVINNGLCNLGRVYQGLGHIEKAKEFFKEAVETPRPAQAHWCDTEDFRFNGHYLLGKIAVEEKNWAEAKMHFKAVIPSCEDLRKSIQDSPFKITFNDTQRKPFQYLQHVMLEEGKEMDALDVAERGRGRDFYDKVESEIPKPLDSVEGLVELIKGQGISVLFISTLEDVGKLCMWFISSDGSLLKQLSIPYSKCTQLLEKHCEELRNSQGRHEIEFRGTPDTMCPLMEKAFELVKRDLQQKCKVTSAPNQEMREEESAQKTARDNATNAGLSDSNRKQGIEDTQKPPTSSSQQNYLLSDLIERLSEVIVNPFVKEFENLVNDRTTNDFPRLLIIPQGKTFNIPFAALKLHGKPLCNYVTIIEAFSFNSFAYFTKESEAKARKCNPKNALIVGNPTHPKNLPQAEEEAKEISRFLDVNPLIGSQATKKAVLERLHSAQLMHFACHGLTEGNGLVLACNGGICR